MKKILAVLCFCLLSIFCVTNTSYAATCTTVKAGENQSSEIGLSANLFCTQEDGAANNVALQWATTLSADYYVVYRSLDEASGYEILYTGTGASYSDYELEVGQTYYYQLEVIDGTSHTFSKVTEITTCNPENVHLYSNEEAGSSIYGTTGIKVSGTSSAFGAQVGAVYYNYSVKSNGNEKYFVETSSLDNYASERVIADKNDNADLGNCKLESVQQTYIPSANKYIIWAHWELPDGYDSGKALVITGTPGGDFTVHHIYNPLGVYVRDMTIFIDDDNTGYLIAAANEAGESANKTMYIFKMTSDYSDVEQVVKKVHEGQYREFPNMVKKDGYYYLFTSQTAGWYPSTGGYIVTKDLGGTWSDLRTIGNTSTFSSQSGWVRYIGNKNYLMNAYRWCRPSGSSVERLCPLYFANGFAFYDYYPAFRYNTSTGELYPVQYGSLVSQGKPAKASVSAKSSTDTATYGVENAFDGSYQTSYTASSCTWPFSMEVDLEKECDLKNVQISWYMCKGSEGYYTYKIEGSTDGSNWSTILDRTDTSDDKVSNTYGFTSDLIDGHARYVRIYVQNAHLHNNPNNNWYTPTVYEVKIFGNETTTESTDTVSPYIQYDFEKAESNSVEDISGNQKNLTLQGNAKCVQENEKGNVLYLDGSDGTYGQLPTGVLDYQNAITVSMDVKSESTGNFFTFLLGNDSNKYLFFKVRNDQFRSAITTNTYSGETGMKLPVDGSQWHNYTLVIDNSVSKVYIDGVPARATSAIGTKISDLGSSLECVIGKSSYSADSYFKGYIDNVTIYKEALNQSQIKALNANGHKWSSEWSSNEENHWHECTNCNTKSDEVTHTMEWITDKEATEYEAGSRHEKCSVCGYEGKSEEIPATHTHDYGTTWKTDEEKHWHECSCGEKQDEAAHTMEWITDKEATATEAGKKHEECSVCGYEGKSEEIPATHTHDYGTTWKTDEEKHWHECSCGEKQDEASHTMEWITDKEATEYEAGSRHEKCSVCGYEGKSEEIPATHTHDYGTTWKMDTEKHWHECSCEDKQDEAAHTMEWITDKEATATEAGKKHEECSVCGYEGKSEEIPATHTHDYGTTWKTDEEKHWHECSCGEKQDEASHTMEWIVDQEATEYEAGSRHEKCSVCGYEGKSEEIPATHTHDYGTTWKTNEEKHWHECSCGEKQDEASHTMKWIVDKEATETEAGRKHEECSVCGYEGESKEIPANHTHDYGTTWKTDEEKHWHECSCGEKQDEATHTMEWIVDKEATETEAGRKHEECSVCGYEGKSEEIPANHTHDYGTTWKTDEEKHWHECSCGEKQDEASHTMEWIVDKEATETEAGRKHEECSVCGYEGESKEIPANHTHDYGTTWKTDEEKHWHECSCGEKQDEATHTMEWIVDQEATETEAGRKHEECSVCGYEGESKEIPANHTHDYGTTWKTDEEKHWHECSCGEKQDEASHTMEWIVDQEATETNAGRKHEECSVCGYEGESKEIPANHTHDYGTTWKTDEEKHWHECSCGEKQDEATHTMEWIVDQEATETEAGRKHEECSVCGYEGESKEIPATHTHDYGTTWKTDEENHWHECSCGEKKDEESHTYDAWKVIRKVTCQIEGMELRSCTVCGKDEIRTIATTGHTMEWIVDLQATTVTEGKRHQECSVCGYKGQEEVIPKLSEEGTTEITTQEVTSGKTTESTTQEVTTGKTTEITTQEMTTGKTTEITTQEITTEQRTEATTQAVTTENTEKVPEKNEIVEVQTGNQKVSYQITNAATNGNGTVTYKANKNTKATSVKVPEEITIQGITYKVTAVADKAFKNNSKLKSVTIGDNVKTIGNNAFYNCKKLTRVVIGKNVTRIGKNAFYKASKLKSITIKSKKLKSVGKNAIKGIQKKAVIKVPKTKKKVYKKLFKKSTGFRSTMKIK